MGLQVTLISQGNPFAAPRLLLGVVQPCSHTMGFRSLAEGSPVAVHPHAWVTCCALWKTQSLHPGGALEKEA